MAVTVSEPCDVIRVGNMYVDPASVHVVSGDGTNRACYIEPLLGQCRRRLNSIQPAALI